MCTNILVIHPNGRTVQIIGKFVLKSQLNTKCVVVKGFLVGPAEINTISDIRTNKQTNKQTN